MFAREAGLRDVAEARLLEIFMGQSGADYRPGAVIDDGCQPVIITGGDLSYYGYYSPIPVIPPHGIVVGTPEDNTRETGVPVSNGHPSDGRPSSGLPAPAPTLAPEPGAPARRKAKRATVLAKDQEQRFERFWAAYPLKYKRGACEAIWARYDPDDAVVDQMLATLAAQLEHLWAGDDARFIPHPKTWLNDKRWLDEVGPRPAPRQPTQAPRGIQRELPRAQAAALEHAHRAAQREAREKGHIP